MRKRVSVIWSLDVDSLIKIVSESKCAADVLEHFDLTSKGNNCRTLKSRLDEEGIDYNHFDKQRYYFRQHKKVPKSLEESLSLFKLYETEREYSSKKNCIRKYLKKYNLIDSSNCSVCDILPTWNGSPLVLQLDHIDGNNRNNNLSNLRWICPNCHSQTHTFAGRNNRIEKNPTDKDWRKKPKLSIRRVERPSREVLEEEIKNNSFLSLSRKYKVSDTAIRKWCQWYGLEYKKRKKISNAKTL